MSDILKVAASVRNQLRKLKNEDRKFVLDLVAKTLESENNVQPE